MSLSKASIADTVQKALAEVSGLALENLKPDTAVGELGLDSLGLSEILISVEDTFNVEIPFEALERFEGITTLGQVYELLEDILCSDSRSASQPVE